MPDMLEKLIEKLRASDKDIIKSSLIEDLANTGDHRALKPLIEALNDTDAMVRWNAVKGIARYGTDAIHLLFIALESPDRFTRRNVVQALGEIATDAVIEKFVKMLMFDESERIVLIEIINSLGRLREPRATDPLITVLKTDDWETKWRAIHALGRIGDLRAIQPLLEKLEDTDNDIRWAAVMAIENIKNANRLDTEENAQETLEEEKAPALTMTPGAARRPAPPLKLVTSEDAKSLSLHVAGEMLSGNVELFCGFIDGAMSGKDKNLVIDLKECRFVDSFALGRLNLIRKRLKARGRKLTLKNLQSNVLRVFKATRLDGVFDIA